MLRTTDTRRTLRTLLIPVVLVATVAAIAGCDFRTAHLEDYHYINQARIARGAAGLGWDDELAAKAKAWAQHLADTGKLSHSNVASGVSPGWSALGENVGVAASTAGVHSAFMNSSQHRNVLLDRRYTSVGVGVVVKGGNVWLVEVYKG
ncbi:MAG: CAP domain-containing protein [Microthrixaceae bacterium]